VQSVAHCASMSDRPPSRPTPVYAENLVRIDMGIKSRRMSASGHQADVPNPSLMYVSAFEGTGTGSA